MFLFIQVAPFAFLLGLLAVLPLHATTRLWWREFFNQGLVCLACALAGILIYLFQGGAISGVLDTVSDYLSFISLVACLYLLSCGIRVEGLGSGRPLSNTAWLVLGACLANLLGGLGASLLLTRPLLQANRQRKIVSHLVLFLIFLVGNLGGVLLPLGPPLYLGVVRGIPFFWTLHLFPAWGLGVIWLAGIFYLVDRVFYAKEKIKAVYRKNQISLKGARNFGLILLILLVLTAANLLPAFYGNADLLENNYFKIGLAIFLLGVGLFAWLSTPAKLHQENQASHEPLLEIGILFIGIFGTLLPALKLLESQAGKLPVERPWQYFWLSGLLSSVLDNAPTYLSFLSLAAGKAGLSSVSLAPLARQSEKIVAAVACGSSFMGALTYIGNAPNLLVKGIAEQWKVHMPSFAAYFGWSLLVLLPLFILQSLFFFQ